ncbi:MAG: hypothetical protein ACOVQ2_04630 [Flavobacterium sp.]|jgi:hypothetical protein
MDLELFGNILVLLEFTTAIVATIYYWKYKNGFIKYLLFYLWYIILHEVACTVAKEFNLMKNSYMLSNLFQFITFTFFLLLYNSEILTQRNRKLLKYFFIIYITSFVLNCLNENVFNVPFANTFILGSVFITTSTILYFIDLLNSDLILKTTKLIMFWISIALFIQYTPLIPFKVVEKYYYDSINIPTLYLSKYILVFLTNIAFLIGFIWSQKIQKE